MRAVVQRVNKAQVAVENKIISKCGIGLLVFLGVEKNDDFSDLQWLASKIIKLRIFSCFEGKMNKSITDIKGKVIVVSQFTLHAKTKKGNRPSFVNCAEPNKAYLFYKDFINELSKVLGENVLSGSFGSKMSITLENDGPVTILIDTKKKE